MVKIPQGDIEKQEVEGRFIIIMKSNWQTVQINRISQKNNPSLIKGYTLILQNHKKTPLKFQCRCWRQHKLDRLICSLIDGTGNIVHFHQLTTRQILFNIRNHIEKTTHQNQHHKDVILQFHEGTLKIITKQNIIKQKSLTENIQDDFSLHKRIQRLIQYIDERLPIFNNLCIALDLRNFGNVLFNSKKERKIKSHQIQLIRRIKHVLLSNNTQPITKNKKIQNNDDFEEEEEEPPTGVPETKKSNIEFIQEIQNQKQTDKSHSGGSSIVLKKKVQSLQTLNSQSRRSVQWHKQLALKIPKDQTFYPRFQREQKIIQKINREGGWKKYLLQYYKPREGKDHRVYMDYHPLNLNEFLFYYRDFLTIKDCFSICKQILDILIDLHKSKIVYRDLKPSNFLVDLTKDITLKLIDFSDSCYEGEILEEDEKLCGTLPYSPIQTSKYYQNYNEEGIRNKQIDYWSAGIIIHEIFYGVFPLTYSSGLAKDILNLWKSQFLYSARSYRRKGLTLIDTVFQVIKLCTVRVSQKQRKQPSKIYDIVNLAEEFYDKITKFILNDHD